MEIYREFWIPLSFAALCVCTSFFFFFLFLMQPFYCQFEARRYHGKMVSCLPLAFFLALMCSTYVECCGADDQC